METLRELLTSLDASMVDIEEHFNRITTRAGNGGATVEEWARITTLGISFNRLKQQRQLLVNTISSIEQTLEAARIRTNPQP